MLETCLNKEASSPSNMFKTRPTELLNTIKVPEMLEGLTTRDGQSIKVMISTKQFANYPGQTTPSPPIIDEVTLDRLRQRN